MTAHPFFGIQDSSPIVNPPEHKLLVVRYQTGPDGQPQLGITIDHLTPQHHFGSLQEAEDWYLGELLAHSKQVQVHQLMGALGIVIGRVGNHVASRTRRGFTTTVLINDAFVSEFDYACNGVIRTFGANNVGPTVGRFTEVGTLTGMTVWASPAVPADRVIVLYKNQSDTSGNVDVSAAYTGNAHGHWLSTQANFTEYAGVVQI